MIGYLILAFLAGGFFATVTITLLLAVRRKQLPNPKVDWEKRRKGIV